MAIPLRRRFWKEGRSSFVLGSLKRARTQPLDEHAYAALNDCTTEIRLCSIVSAPDDAILRVECYPVRLSELQKRPFKCISYVWGDEKDKNEIILNGRIHLVTRNLYIALCRLRACGKGNDIWADALSINQRDDIEKTAQVGLMGQIYGRAEEVIISICDGTGDGAWRLSDNATVKATLLALAGDKHIYELDCYVTKSKGLKRPKDVDASLRRFFNSQWFTRTWTVQEYCLARHATLLCPWGPMEWDLLVEAVRHWDEHRRSCCGSFAEKLGDDIKDAVHRVFCHVVNLAYTRNGLEGEQHILQVITLFQHLNVTDHRDKFFAFRALDTVGDRLPPPDYSKSKTNIFTDLAVWLLETTQTPYLLALDLRNSSTTTPSWVLDLSVAPPIEHNYWKRRLRFFQEYNASAGLDWSLQYEGPGQLSLSGIELDSVDVFTKRSFSMMENAEHGELLKEWYDFYRQSRADSLAPDDGLFDDRFSESMLAGLVEDGEHIRKVSAGDLADWRQLIVKMMRYPSIDSSISHAPVMAAHMTAVLHRRFFRTSNGRIGVGPQEIQRGDVVCVLARGSAPFILRKASQGVIEDPRYLVVGHCYIHGVMEGQAVTADAVARRFVIV